MSKFIQSVGQCIGLLACLAISLAAQTTSAVSGMIQDQTGAVIAGATVSARNLETNQTRKVLTDGTGRYSFPELRVGAYEIKAEQTGFKPETRTIRLTIGDNAEVNLALLTGLTSTTVEVTDANGGNIVAQGPNQYGSTASKPAPYVNGIPSIVRFTIRPTGSTKLVVRVKNAAGAVQYTRDFPVTTR